MHCNSKLSNSESRWGTGLCDPCYGGCEKQCQSCGNALALQQLHYQTGLCNGCYDKRGKTCERCGE